MKKFLIIIVILSVIIIAFVLLVSGTPANQTNSVKNLGPQGEEVPILGRDHVPEGTKVKNYNSNPPTSGSHWPTPAPWGFYSEPVPDEVVVHNLEHGGIWISYKSVDDATIAKLKAIAEKYSQAVIVTPREENDTAIALASWGRLEKLAAFDAGRIEQFIKANINNSPEPLASLEKAKVVRGKPAPEAHFTTLGGEDTHLSDFKGQKVMLWLLATWCPSCITGARVLAENNDKLGNIKIIALKSYGNAGYPGPSIEEFAKSYTPQMLSAENWLWGDASKDTTEIYNPKNYPDIYFLVDENGTLRVINGAPAATLNKIVEFVNDQSD